MTATHIVIAVLGVSVCIAAVSGWQRYLDARLAHMKSAHKVRMSELETERLQIVERYLSSAQMRSKASESIRTRKEEGKPSGGQS